MIVKGFYSTKSTGTYVIYPNCRKQALCYKAFHGEQRHAEAK